MKKSGMLFILVLIMALAFPMTVFAQGIDGETETFDSAELEGWELSPETAVVDGVLKISPGQFALKFGDYSDIDLELDLLYTPPGELIVHYYFREESHYKVVFLENEAILLRFENEAETDLGHFNLGDSADGDWMTVQISVSGSSHTVTIDGAEAFTVSDENPLPAGAIMLNAFGENAAEIDNFSLSGTESMGGFVEGDEPVEGEPPMEGEPQPEEPGMEPGIEAPETQGSADLETGSSGSGSLFEEFFSSQADNLSLTTFAINLLLAVLASYILGLVYIHWGTSLSNRRKFSANFMLMTITTTFIILVVRSSIALSLGLVGALSIVRFRAAIKEPEELPISSLLSASGLVWVIISA